MIYVICFLFQAMTVLNTDVQQRPRCLLIIYVQGKSLHEPEATMILGPEG